MKQICSVLLLLYMHISLINSEPSVHILAVNLDQLVTSTTLEWVPSNGNNKAILQNAVIAAYQSIEDQDENGSTESEVEETENNILNKPVYVCRAKVNSVWVSGQLRPKQHACIVSLYKKVSEYKQFEILINIEGSARLSWVHKDKYTLISQGAVTSGENVLENVLRSFIARRAANNHNKEGSLTHNVGKFNPSENLGVFQLVDQNNNELQFEDGEILVETEPIRYELKSIRFDRYRGRYPKKPTVLGQATLKNEENGLQRVDSVISYSYSYSLFWGKGHGLLTGLPLKVNLPNGTYIEGQWAIPEEQEREDLAQVEKYLEEGTAVNVTLIGNYTESEIPYYATVVAIYKDEEKREITIKDTKRENKMIDVVAVYGPVYFLHNNSHVPTTTTTTTSTTTTSTTTKTTSTTQFIPPIVQPEVVPSKKKVDDVQSSDKKHENGSMLSDEHNSDRDALSLKKKETKESTSDAASTELFSLATVSIVTWVIRRVT